MTPIVVDLFFFLQLSYIYDNTFNIVAMKAESRYHVLSSVFGCFDGVRTGKRIVVYCIQFPNYYCFRLLVPYCQTRATKQ